VTTICGGQATNARTTKVARESRAAPYMAAVAHTPTIMSQSAARAAKEMNKKSGMSATSLGNAILMPKTMRIQPSAIKASGTLRRKVDTIGCVFSSFLGGTTKYSPKVTVPAAVKSSAALGWWEDTAANPVVKAISMGAAARSTPIRPRKRGTSPFAVTGTGRGELDMK